MTMSSVVESKKEATSQSSSEKPWFVIFFAHVHGASIVTVM